MGRFRRPRSGSQSRHRDRQIDTWPSPRGIVAAILRYAVSQRCTRRRSPHTLSLLPYIEAPETYNPSLHGTRRNRIGLRRRARARRSGDAIPGAQPPIVRPVPSVSHRRPVPQDRPRTLYQALTRRPPAVHCPPFILAIQLRGSRACDGGRSPQCPALSSRAAADPWTRPAQAPATRATQTCRDARPAWHRTGPPPKPTLHRSGPQPFVKIDAAPPAVQCHPFILAIYPPGESRNARGQSPPTPGLLTESHGSGIARPCPTASQTVFRALRPRGHGPVPMPLPCLRRFTHTPLHRQPARHAFEGADHADHGARCRTLARQFTSPNPSSSSPRQPSHTAKVPHLLFPPPEIPLSRPSHHRLRASTSRRHGKLASTLEEAGGPSSPPHCTRGRPRQFAEFTAPRLPRSATPTRRPRMIRPRPSRPHPATSALMPPASGRAGRPSSTFPVTTPAALPRRRPLRARCSTFDARRRRSDSAYLYTPAARGLPRPHVLAHRGDPEDPATGSASLASSRPSFLGHMARCPRAARRSPGDRASRWRPSDIRLTADGDGGTLTAIRHSRPRGQIRPRVQSASPDRLIPPPPRGPISPPLDFLISLAPPHGPDPEPLP